MEDEKLIEKLKATLEERRKCYENILVAVHSQQEETLQIFQNKHQQIIKKLSEQSQQLDIESINKQEQAMKKKYQKKMLISQQLDEAILFLQQKQQNIKGPHNEKNDYRNRTYKSPLREGSILLSKKQPFYFQLFEPTAKEYTFQKSDKSLTSNKKQLNQEQRLKKAFKEIQNHRHVLK